MYLFFSTPDKVTITTSSQYFIHPTTFLFLTPYRYNLNETISGQVSLDALERPVEHVELIFYKLETADFQNYETVLSNTVLLTPKKGRPADDYVASPAERDAIVGQGSLQVDVAIEEDYDSAVSPTYFELNPDCLVDEQEKDIKVDTVNVHYFVRLLVKYARLQDAEVKELGIKDADAERTFWNTSQVILYRSKPQNLVAMGGEEV